MDDCDAADRGAVQQGRLVPRWVAPVFLVLGVLTIPWIVLLAVQLPQRVESPHYDVAWVGFDIALVTALLRTAWTSWRGKPYVEVPAVITATLLVVDAWFDVLTTPGGPSLVLSVVQALVVELPLAALCIWVARHAETVREMRVTRLRVAAARLRRERRLPKDWAPPLHRSHRPAEPADRDEHPTAGQQLHSDG